MVLNQRDKAVIEGCFREKGWCGVRIVREFPDKKWNMRTVNRLIEKIRISGSTRRK